MTDQDLIDIFEDCLNRLAAGETVEQVLRRYAAYDADLRPLLQTVRLAQRALPSANEVAPAQARGRARLLAELNTRPVAVARPAPANRWWMAVAALLLVCLGLGAVTANSLPGDPLYSLKRGVENAANSLSIDPQAAEEAARRRRIDEIYMLIALGRPAAVEFSGEIEMLSADQWRVSGLTLQLDADTEYPATARIGDRVGVTADVTAERTLIARTIRLLQPERIDITPEATATPASATPSQTASPTQTPSPSQTPLPSATQTPAETALPSQRADCTTQRPDGWLTYRVRAGDSLSGLASATGTTIDAIVQANCLPDSGLIVVNQPLYLPFIPPTRAPALNPPAPTTAATTAAVQPGSVNPPPASSVTDDDDDDDRDDHSGPGSSDDASDDDEDDAEDDHSGHGSDDASDDESDDD
jgi:LysM repeat protein